MSTTWHKGEDVWFTACPGPECPYCSGEACRMCGPDLGMDVTLGKRPPCEHDAVDRHRVRGQT